MDKTEHYTQSYRGEFKKIDTEEKAYFLGYFHADGNLYYSKTAYSSQTKIKLGIKDEEILRKFLVFFPFFSFSYTSDVYEYKGVIKRNNKCLIRSYNRQLFKDLTLIKVKGDIPIIDPKLVPHFIRGLIDGDGSYNIYSRQKNAIYYAMDLCMQDINLAKKVGILLAEYNIHATYNADRTIMKLRVRRKDDLVKLIHVLYDTSTIYLERKYKIINRILQCYTSPH